MPFWQELALKAVVLAAVLLALCGTLVLFAVGTLANGSVVAGDDFSWTFAALDFAAISAQIWLTIAGCRSAWRWIERWSAE